MTARHSAREYAARRGSALVALALGLSGCVTAPSGEATPLWMGAVSNGAQVISATPVSWKDKKFDNLVRQETDFSCGAAVLATVFNYAFGHQTTERQVLVNMLKIADPDIVRQKGFSLLGMKNYAQSVGFEAEGYRVDYPTLQKLDIPSIALIDIKGYKHFVVIRKAYADHIAIGDPALGNRTMSRSEFQDAWNDVAFVVNGEGYDPTTVLLNPPAPLSALRLLEHHTNIPAAEVADFGFGPRFSF